MFTARAATAEDYAVFAKLFPELEVHDPIPNAQQWTDRMMPRTIILLRDGAPAGYGYFQIYGSSAHLCHVVVDPRERGRGAGRALMEALFARTEGCTRRFLNVKAHNTAAVRLYQRCGLTIEHESWALDVPFAAVDRLAGEAAEVYRPGPEEDAAIARIFHLDAERIAFVRDAGRLLFAIRDVAFAAFDPAFPGAYPFRVARTSLARPLLEAMRSHARTDYVHMPVEGDAATKDALVAAGAKLCFALYQMASSQVVRGDSK
jgi:ribosomal protein S18 acetylase RimI-like enzyme